MSTKSIHVFILNHHHASFLNNRDINLINNEELRINLSRQLQDYTPSLAWFILLTIFMVFWFVLGIIPIYMLLFSFDVLPFTIIETLAFSFGALFISFSILKSVVNFYHFGISPNSETNILKALIEKGKITSATVEKIIETDGEFCIIYRVNVKYPIIIKRYFTNKIKGLKEGQRLLIISHGAIYIII